MREKRSGDRQDDEHTLRPARGMTADARKALSTHSHLPRNRPRSQRGRAERAYLPRVDGNYAGWAGQVRTQPRLPKPRHDRLGAHHDVDPLVLGRDDKPDWRTAQGGLVGAKRPQTAIRVPTRGDLWAPTDAKWRFVTPCEGICGCQGRGNAVSGPNRGHLWAPTRPIATHRLRGRGCVVVERRIAPRRGRGRVGRVVGQRTVHSAHLPPVELPCPRCSENREGRPRRRRGQTGSGYR